MKISLKNRVKGDPVIWTAIVILCVYSLLAIYSGLSNMPRKDRISEDLFAELEILRQLLFIIVGLLIMWSIHLFQWRRLLKAMAPLILLIAWALILVTMFWGENINLSTRGIRIGPITVQTFDIAKLALIIYLAAIMANVKEFRNSFKSMLIWVYLPIFITCGLILPSNLSTALICFAVAAAMMFFGPMSIKNIAHFLGLTIVCGLLLVVLIKSEAPILPRAVVWEKRIDSFFSGEEVVKDKDEVFQKEQAKIAIGTGGIFGKGPGRGTQRHILPQSFDDYIFAIIVEEYGVLFGAIPLVIIYLILLYRGFRIALKSKRRFSSYLVFGITFLYVLQAFLHIMVSTGMMPVTGQPLPFVSRGGMALMVACVSFGLVLSESRLNEKERLKELEGEAEGETEATEDVEEMEVITE